MWEGQCCGAVTNQVILVVANRRDAPARAFVERYAAHGVCLLTPADLSIAGWYHRLGDLGTAVAVVAGRPLAACDIAGVVTRLPCVVEEDLGHITPVDRAYVAAEMTAFLRFWLQALPCPMLNRPTPLSLSGPVWRHEKWVHTAARLGMLVAPARRQVMCALDPLTPAHLPSAVSTVTIVGQRAVGDVDQVLATQARALADAAGVDLLAVQFSAPGPGAVFVRAHLWPDIAAAGVAEAIYEYFHVRP
jgi:hypothetical protein